MSKENVEIVRRVYEAVARRDGAAVLSLYDPGVEWDYTRGTFEALITRRVYRGHEDLRGFFRELYEAWDRLDFEPEELIDAGNRVVAVVVNRGRGRTSGVEV